ncbi:EamA family transporter [bacterium BFN5]|nr:EamA family transporter [bacterium BFN5]QJW46840.1 EamA family transporter [bacterium BFN5]
MTGLALLLLLSAAFFHAFWNYIAKKACAGAVFIWLFNAVASIIYIPIVILAIWSTKSQFTLDSILPMLGSAILHVGYFVLLNKGYEIGELSLVYPLARGSGPLLSTLAAIFFLGEQPSWIALMGTVLIAAGVLLLLGNPRSYLETKAFRAILFAILAGFFIASYTLWDKYAVSIMAIPPILMYWGTTVCQALLMLPYAMRNSETVIDQWNINKSAVLGVAILCPLSYILVLTTMVFTPVSYVAPAREVSILIGAIIGARFLAEGDAKLRIAAATIILSGLTSLALG